ncbi:hypothetical protein V1264_023065 [Littorina saxatilis]|uniref:Tyrosine-protein phosphatase domain-containing protein n=1 Tax=Littorina saxatilis TaxID=31220 RepID=A0AAN9B787_9CAEN
MYLSATLPQMLTNIPGCELREDDIVVKMFQVCGGGSNPSKGRVALPPKSLMATLEAAENWQQRNNPLNPICILSKDGASRCGIYCAVHICCDQLKTDGEVDILNAVRLVRHNRPQLVTTIDEYRYIYSFMTDYVRSMVARGPQIVITGAEGDNAPVRAPLQSPDGLSTDESMSVISSQAGSFETALDDVMDFMLPGNPEARLTACIAQLSPHMSHRNYMSDRLSFPSTDSLSSLHCSPPRSNDSCLSSVGFMASSVATAFAPETFKNSVALVNNFALDCTDRLLSEDGGGVSERARLGDCGSLRLDKAVGRVGDGGCCGGGFVAEPGRVAGMNSRKQYGALVNCVHGDSSERLAVAEGESISVRTPFLDSFRQKGAFVNSNNHYERLAFDDGDIACSERSRAYAADPFRQHAALVNSVNHNNSKRRSTGECGVGCERRPPERKLERRNTNDSFHSVGSSLHLWQT